MSASPVREHVALVRSAWKAPSWLSETGVPTTLTPELERACTAVLRPWWARLASVRERYDRGELTGEERARTRYSGQRRAAGFDNVEMTEAEREAAFTLYVTLVAFVAKLVYQAHKCFPIYDEDTVYYPPPLEDTLAGSYELFLQTLSAFDPNRGATLVTFVGVDLPSKLYAAIRLASTRETSLEDEEEPEQCFTGDVEGYLDFAGWAERFTKGNPQLRSIWEGLTGQDL